ncbi:hypothetical protein Bca4012_066124 [Brassica carinata]|uniref:Uncharacterized protein n=1 Tax=Brassica carinata TaxID=52824 RepID=A0A8X8AYH4_BRACI|nr:hypothetical protein Bca52824_018414 [Brassica carinata]
MDPNNLSEAQKAALEEYKVSHANEIEKLKEEAIDLIRECQKEHMPGVLTEIKCALNQQVLDKFYWAMEGVVTAVWEQKRDAKVEMQFPQEVLDASGEED